MALGSDFMAFKRKGVGYVLLMLISLLALARPVYAGYSEAETNPIIVNPLSYSLKACTEKYGAHFCQCIELADGSESCYYQAPAAGFYTLDKCEEIWGKGACECLSKNQCMLSTKSGEGQALSCAGEIYIFSGLKYECREAGVSTLAQDCCEVPDENDDKCGFESMSDNWFENLLHCKESEYKLGCRRSVGVCHKTGSKCTIKIFGHCLQRKKIFCCFDSVIAKIVQEQGRAQLGMGWGSCRGFTMKEFQQLDFSSMDMSEYSDDISRQMLSEEQISDKISNALEKWK